MTIRSTAPSSTTARASRILDRRRGRPKPRSSMRRRPTLDPLEGRTLLTAGTLDPSFGQGGYVLTDTGSDGEWGNDVLIQEDGKIVVAGSDSPSRSSSFLLARHNSDGSLDTSFGDNGLVTTSFSNQTSDSAQAVALQPDGKIVVAGTGDDMLGLARYHPDGSLDRSFGDRGTTTAPVGPGPVNDLQYDLLVAPDGTLVVVVGFEVARFRPDGSLDPGFGVDGVSLIDFPDGSYADAAAFAPDGSIILAGRTPGPDNSLDIAMARLLPDGQLDPSFGGDGTVSTDFTTDPDLGQSNEQATRIAVQPDGRILATGGILPAGEDGTPMLVRYLDNGDLDTSFGTDGLVTTPFPPLGSVRSALARDMAFQQNGRIVTTGYLSYTDGGKDYFLIRYEPDGMLDATFGTDGITTADFGSSREEPSALAIQPSDGRIVVTGYTVNANDPNDPWDNHADIVVARFEGDPPTSPPGVTVSPTAGLETTEAGGTASFSVVLDAPPAADVTIPIASGDTTEGTVSPASLTFTTADWDQPQAVVVTGVDDTDVDGDVPYTIALGPASSTDLAYDGLDPADVAVTNRDDDQPVDPPTISIADLSMAEGNDGVTSFTFTVTLSKPAPAGGVSVDYSTADGTAEAGLDYAATSGTLFIPEGETSGTITVEVFGNTRREGDETFFLDLSNVIGASLVDTRAVGTILNDDQGKPYQN